MQMRPGIRGRDHGVHTWPDVYCREGFAGPPVNDAGVIEHEAGWIPVEKAIKRRHSGTQVPRFIPPSIDWPNIPWSLCMEGRGVGCDPCLRGVQRLESWC